MSSETNVVAVSPQGEALLVRDNFLPLALAQAMRAQIDSHFSAPYTHRPETHQVWNYWFVPDTYTYFRTQPEKVIQRAAVEHFMGVLRVWSIETLGLGWLSWPYLSFYVSGCRQALHNDARNGRFGFVYSLTRDDRRSTGGETLVMRRGDPFLRNLRKPSAGPALYELIEPKFNRLVVFDDRMVHGVQLVEGAMNPSDGRFVLHGHIQESGPILRGPLPAEALMQGLRPVLERFDRQYAEQAKGYDGPLVLRFTVSREGRVGGLGVLLDRVFAEREGDEGWSAIRNGLIGLVATVAFPHSADETSVTLPLRFGAAGRATQERAVGR